MSFFRFRGGRIVEEWSTYDNLSIMRQLGLTGS
jgi:predicted ester cyclase